MPVEIVSGFEEQFYKYYKNDVIHFPLKSNLDFKDNYLDEEVVAYIM
jgi:hypothetical protein